MKRLQSLFIAVALMSGSVLAQTTPANTWSDIAKGSKVATTDSAAADKSMSSESKPRVDSVLEDKQEQANKLVEVKKEKIPNSIAVTELGFTRNIAERHVRESFESDEAGTRSERTVSVRRLTEYLELRGLTSNIRAALIKEGLPVIEAGSGIAIAENDERATLFDIKRRVQKGEFNNAEFVLLGTLVDFSPIMKKSIIPGSDGVLYEWGLDLVADFKLINTETMQVAAAFTASGVGVEKRLVNTETAASMSVPRRAKIVADIADSLAKNAARLLADQGVLLGQDKEASEAGRDARLDNKKYVPYEDKNVRVYKN